MGPHRYPSLSVLQENSPSLRDGIPWDQEQRIIRAICKMICDVGEQLEL